MAEEKQAQNGTAQPAVPALKDGEQLLFAKFNSKTAEFMPGYFPDLLTAVHLHKLLGKYLDAELDKAFGFGREPQITVPVPTIPGGLGKFLK